MGEISYINIKEGQWMFFHCPSFVLKGYKGFCNYSMLLLKNCKQMFVVQSG
ncbi:hypothetical protein HMPREF0648_1923 [Prevotella bivia JCVIHMP010]|nr:hypothetical protein HMPREF0648_1923 [Prevotella bivia JCVIHMP010]